MKEQGFDRRDFLKTAVVGGAAAAGGTTTIATPEMAQAQQPAASGDGRVRLSQS
jgi:gluconate 2-dehydrogenase gamma chain